ncbi:ABC transporter substrate-binding protein [Lutibaculum baratangense]|uniref:Periplasmic spermidine/putrescine-binding protein or ABC transporter n=1 Tax=Lutibaculum baratangense AMV1 TaxID=631454 RepID=V4TMP2_9HYPH|nr:extracellular solute-binding protein [Lutibaculum baratangense]ESR27013.1 periplasmic spermidine/putrescine-binding protein or ABC transporter [Lutibaculum baratangense AMV1]
MLKLSRRRMLTLTGSGLVALAGSRHLVRPARAAGRITVLNWQGYGTDERWAVEAFTEATGIEVVHDYFNSEAEMLTKLRTNPGVYDVVLINSARSQQAAGEGLLMPVDLANYPNAEGLAPSLRENEYLKTDGELYGVAWVWGMNSLAIRDGMEAPTSYAALAAPEFRNKVALFDDAVTMVGLGALLSGQDMNDPSDMAAVVEKLKEMKPNVRLLWSSEDQWNKAFSAGEFDLSIYWSGAAVRSQKTFDLPLQFVVPEEGAIGWLDSFSIPATSQNPDEAAQFIDYMIDPGFYTKWAIEVGAPASANAAAMEALPEDNLIRQIHDPEYLETMTLMAPLPDDRRETFNNAWQEVKAFYAS